MISVVIPTLNEAGQLPATLAAIQANRPRAGLEVILVDAGSSDDTVELASASGARVVMSPEAQRAAQMNLGARNARGDVLLFLHADTLLAESALPNLEAALDDPEVVGGGFARRFASPSRCLRLTCRLADWRCRRLGWFLGDQAIFARREAFERLGGYRPLDLFEDLDFSRRLARVGRVVTLDPPVVSSARRFADRGVVSRTCSDLWLTFRYLSGADPQKLTLRASKGPGPALRRGVSAPRPEKGPRGSSPG